MMDRRISIVSATVVSQQPIPFQPSEPELFLPNNNNNNGYNLVNTTTIVDSSSSPPPNNNNNRNYHSNHIPIQQQQQQQQQRTTTTTNNSIMSLNQPSQPTYNQQAHLQDPSRSHFSLVSSQSVHPSIPQPFTPPKQQHLYSSPSSSNSSSSYNNPSMVVHSNHQQHFNNYQFPPQQQHNHSPFSSKPQHVNNNSYTNNLVDTSQKILPSISEWFRGDSTGMTEMSPMSMTPSFDTMPQEASSPPNVSFSSSILVALNQKNVTQHSTHSQPSSELQPHPSVACEFRLNSQSAVNVSPQPTTVSQFVQNHSNIPHSHHVHEKSTRIVQSKSLLRTNSDSSGCSMSPKNSSSSAHGDFNTQSLISTNHQTHQSVINQNVCPAENVRKPNRGKAPNRQSNFNSAQSGESHNTTQTNTCSNNNHQASTSCQDQQHSSTIHVMKNNSNHMDTSHSSPIVKVATTTSAVVETTTRHEKRHNNNQTQQDHTNNKKDNIVLVIENVESIKQYIAEKEMAQQHYSTSGGHHSRRISAKEVWNSIAAATAANNGKFLNENKIKKQSKMKHSRANSPMSLGGGSSASPSILERRFSNVSLFEKLSLEDVDMKTSVTSSTSQDHNMMNNIHNSNNGMNNNNLQGHNNQVSTGPFITPNAYPSQMQHLHPSQALQLPIPQTNNNTTTSNVHLLGNEFVDFSKGEHEIQKKTRGEKVYKFKMIKF
nr:unnamed protein product [Naegleria fowleri]